MNFQLSGNFHDHFDADQGADFVVFQVAGEIMLGRRGNSKASAGDLRCGLRFEFNDGLAQIEPARPASLLVAADASVCEIAVGGVLEAHEEIVERSVISELGHEAEHVTECVRIAPRLAPLAGKIVSSGKLTKTSPNHLRRSSELKIIKMPSNRARNR
jgi:hypothetical protein